LIKKEEMEEGGTVTLRFTTLDFLGVAFLEQGKKCSQHFT
jgi:hypothetical protein